MTDQDTAARTMAQAIEEMNACITTAELTFRRLNLGVSASTPFPTAETGPRSLRFARHDASWALLVVWDAPVPIRPLLNCDLKTRQIALSMLPALYGEMLSVAQSIAQDIKRATADATAFLESLARSDAFCVHCPGDRVHKMSCTAAKNGYVGQNEPCHVRDLSTLSTSGSVP